MVQAQDVSVPCLQACSCQKRSALFLCSSILAFSAASSAAGWWWRLGGISKLILNQDLASSPTALTPCSAGITFELVIASFCENPDWFLNWNVPKVVYLKDGSCAPRLHSAVPWPTVDDDRSPIEMLPNFGREGQSYLFHIVRHYHNLATYTAFAQGSGYHNDVQVVDEISRFLAEMPNPPVAFYPLVRRTEQGPMMYRDADEGEVVAPGENTSLNTYVFPFLKEHRISDRARSAYAGLFGGSTCQSPPMLYAAGAQFIVHKDAILAKPLKFWQHLEKLTRTCHLYGWLLERNWAFIMDPGSLPLARPTVPGYCQPPMFLWSPELCSAHQEQSKPWSPPPILARSPC